MARYLRPEQPKPIGTIVGVVVALGAVLVFMVLVVTGVIAPKRKEQSAPPPAGRPAATPAGVASPASGAPSAPPQTSPVSTASGLGVVRFLGRFDERENTRRVETDCPACGKAVDSGIPKCPFCGANINWPEKVACGFCAKDKPGDCGVCVGTGACPFCGKGPRMLMGVKPPCDACKQSGKCPACQGTGKCGYCDGGFYYPGRPVPVKPAQGSEAPPAPPPPPATDAPAPAEEAPAAAEPAAP